MKLTVTDAFDAGFHPVERDVVLQSEPAAFTVVGAKIVDYVADLYYEGRRVGHGTHPTSPMLAIANALEDRRYD